MSRYLFLDIDGVLNNTKWCSSPRNPGNLDGQKAVIDPLNMVLLHVVIKNTDCKIVISSDWRYDFENCCKQLYKAGLPEGVIIDKTPEFIWREGLNDEASSRGSEIQEWIDKNLKEGDTYCIVDDRTDILDCQESCFIHINPYVGLQPKDCLAICKILLKN